MNIYWSVSYLLPCFNIKNVGYRIKHVGKGLNVGVFRISISTYCNIIQQHQLIISWFDIWLNLTIFMVRNGYEMSFPLHQQWPTESFERFTLIYDGIIEFHFELCKTSEQNANTRDVHLFYGTRILPDFIENNRWIQINRTRVRWRNVRYVSEFLKVPEIKLTEFHNFNNIWIY